MNILNYSYTLQIKIARFAEDRLRKIIIDTDCGVDDAVAIMMALSAEDVEIAGITTVSGNTQVKQVTENVLRLLSYFGRGSIPVYKGASVPLVAAPHHGERIHGQNGLGDVELPPAGKKTELESAPAAIYRIAKENPGLTLITLGPLTNIAIALNLYPDLKDFIERIVAMGGALETGNVTRFAEFNFYFDPEAVQFVINSGIAMSIVPWDPIVKVPFTEEELKELIPEGSRAGKLFLDIQQVTMSFIEKFHGIRATMLPDPAAMAFFIDKSVASGTISGNLKMELNYNTLRGASILNDGARMEIVTELNRERFKEAIGGIFKLG